MVKKILVGIVLIVLFLLFAACEDKAAKPEKPETLGNNNPTKQEVSTMEASINSNSTQQSISISKNEFDVNYDNITINADIPFETIAHKLGINIVTCGGVSDSRTEIYASTSVGSKGYTWSKVSLPSIENADLTLEYVADDAGTECYLVYASLFKETKTYRGIKVGDSLEKFLKTYSGLIYENGDNDNFNKAWYYYVGDESNKQDYSGICVLIGKNSNKIEEISIDYNVTKAREEMQLGGD